ncbi:MAG: DISARM system phospholipase D-like protein DrmC [Planctomycetota bacterium]
MNAGEEELIEMAVQVAARLPHEMIAIVNRAILQSPGDASSQGRTNIGQKIPHPYYRDIVTDFMNCWRNAAPQLSPQQVSLCLLTAAKAEQVHQKSQSFDLVWTGPEVDGIPFRRTEQAILQVLDSARERITLVSYAVYKIPRICKSLVRAAHRGVRITVIIETPNRVEGQTEYDTLKALGENVAAVSTVYYWPEAQRNSGGKQGILHVKCAAADGQWLFLSSANLTEYAFTVNMELGMLVTGGPLPCQVEEQFDRLIAMGVLESVTN